MEIKDIKSEKKYRVVISGGGTGGHFYPAIAVAERLKAHYGEDIEILFVGANGKMEMEKVPLMGWNIIGLNIAGLQRKLTLKNLSLPFKVIGSYMKSKRIINKFQPQAAFGSGGYVTLPIIGCAARCNVPTFIWEGNSYPGMANRRLAKKAYRVFVPHKKMLSFFNRDKTVVSGTPLRGAMAQSNSAREEGYGYFGLNRDKKTILVVGGSLGTRVFNDAIIAHYDEIKQSEVNLIWQSGKAHHAKVMESVGSDLPSNIWVSPFIDRMDLAYNVADIVISRAGASSLAELALTERPSILVPSSWVPDDHQTKNAMTYVEEGAAVMITDAESVERLIPETLRLLADDEALRVLSNKIKLFAEPKAADIIADEIMTVLDN